MKKLKYSFLVILYFYIGLMCLFANDDEKPYKQKLKIGDRIEKIGEIEIWDGWPPPFRMGIDNKYIIGIGKDENVKMPEIIKKYLYNYFIDVTLILEYIGDANIIYYDAPLMCFNIIEVVKLKVKKFDKENDEKWQIIIP
jgi:hypothetical protein